MDFLPSAVMGSRRKCTACGNVGHIKTNPKCPKKQEPLDGNPPQPPQPSKEQLGVLMARAAESDEHIEIPKKLERVWELSKKLVEASRGVSPSPVRGARVRDLHPSQFPSPGSSPAGPSLQPASPSPQTPGSTFVAHVADRPELLKAFYSEIVDLLKLDAAVGHSSMTLDYLASKCGSQVAGLAELIMGALTPFSGLLGKRSYSITAQVRSAIAAKCQDNANLQVELLTLPDDVAKHLLRAIHPKFLYIEQLSHIDLRSEHQLYGGVSMLLYAVLSYSKGLPVLNLEALSTPSEEAGTLPGQVSQPFRIDSITLE